MQIKIETSSAVQKESIFCDARNRRKKRTWNTTYKYA